MTTVNLEGDVNFPEWQRYGHMLLEQYNKTSVKYGTVFIDTSVMNNNDFQLFKDKYLQDYESYRQQISGKFPSTKLIVGLSFDWVNLERITTGIFRQYTYNDLYTTLILGDPKHIIVGACYLQFDDSLKKMHILRMNTFRNNISLEEFYIRSREQLFSITNALSINAFGNYAVILYGDAFSTNNISNGYLLNYAYKCGYHDASFDANGEFTIWRRNVLPIMVSDEIAEKRINKFINNNTLSSEYYTLESNASLSNNAVIKFDLILDQYKLKHIAPSKDICIDFIHIPHNLREGMKFLTFGITSFDSGNQNLKFMDIVLEGPYKFEKQKYDFYEYDREYDYENQEIYENVDLPVWKTVIDSNSAIASYGKWMVPMLNSSIRNSVLPSEYIDSIVHVLDQGARFVCISFPNGVYILQLSVYATVTPTIVYNNTNIDSLDVRDNTNETLLVVNKISWTDNENITRIATNKNTSSMYCHEVMKPSA